MARIVDGLVTGVIIISAIAVGGAAIHREFAAPKARLAQGMGPPTYRKGWEGLSRLGEWIGDSNAKVKIVEFADFECPFCRRFHKNFDEMRQVVGGDVGLLFIQYPLSIHKFAKPAAYAAECAVKQGRWERFQDALFANQDSFGLKTWASYAAVAGIRDTVAFNSCLSAMKSAVRVDSALAVAKSFQLHGTPTVIIDGWQYGRTPYDSLTSIVEAELKNGPPKPNPPK